MALLDKHTARKIQQTMMLTLAGALSVAEQRVSWRAPAQAAVFDVRWLSQGGCKSPCDIVVTTRSDGELPRTAYYALYSGFCLAHSLSAVWSNGGDPADS
jgi:hypothetical protein